MSAAGDRRIEDARKRVVHWEQRVAHVDALLVLARRRVAELEAAREANVTQLEFKVIEHRLEVERAGVVEGRRRVSAVVPSGRQRGTE